MDNVKIKFQKIPFEFISATLTDTQKRIVELRYSIYNEKKSEGMNVRDFFVELSKKYNLSEHTIEKQYWTIKKRLNDYYSNHS